MIEEISKQRDMYKQMLNETQIEKAEQRVSSTMVSISDKNAIEKQALETQNALDKLQQKFDKYQQEISETNRQLNDDIDRYRQLNSELNTKNALNESKLESVTEKCKTLNTTVEKYKKECETLKERNAKFSELIVKHEQSINQLNMEIHKQREKQSELETSLRNSNIERDLFKSNQERLQVEADLLKRENQSRTFILQNLETIKNSCERNEREAKLMYHEKIEQLEKENVIMKKRLETEEEQKRILHKSWDSQLKELNNRLDFELKEHDKTKGLYLQCEENLKIIKSKLNETEAKLHSSEQLIQITRNSKSSSAISRLTELEEETKDLQLKLALSEKEIVNLKMQLEDEKAHSKQYNIIADNMEKTLRESCEANEKAKKLLEERCQKLQQDNKNLEINLNNLQKLKDELDVEFKNQNELNEIKFNDLNQTYKVLLNEFNNTKEKLTQTELVLAERTESRDACVAQIRILEEKLNSEFNTENELKQTIDTLNERLNELYENNSKLTNELTFKVKSIDDLNQQLVNTEHVNKEKLSQFENENKNLTQQISVLQDELVKLGESLQVLQKDSFKSASSLHLFEEKTAEAMLTINEGGEIEENERSKRRESFNNLLEINRFLRSQKDQLDEKYQNMALEHGIIVQHLQTCENELDSYKQQVKLNENEIEHLKLQLNSAKQQSTVNNDDFNLIVDSNKRLTEQYNSLLSELNEKNEKLKQFDENYGKIKEEKCALDIEKEALCGEKLSMQLEIKRLKERVDSLLRNSDIGEEWKKAQAEINELNDKTQLLTDMINELRKNNTNLTVEKDNVIKEYDGYKQITQEEKKQLTNELETAKAERAKKEELFKNLISDLKDVVTTVQKALEIKDSDIRAQSAEKPRNIKEELKTIKSAIIERIKHDKDEYAARLKEINELKTKSKEIESQIQKLNETDTTNKSVIDSLTKRVNDLEVKNKQLQEQLEKTKNVITTARGKIESQNQRIKELTVQKEEIEAKLLSEPAKTTITTTTTTSAAVAQPPSSTSLNITTTPTQTSKTQSQLTQPATTATSIPPTTSPSTASTTALTTTNTNQSANNILPSVSSLLNSQQSTSIASSSTIENNNTQASFSQAPPTAYIAPSRINKITPLNTRPSTMTNFGGAGDASRRTAAVQPTPHESTTAAAAVVTTTAATAIRTSLTNTPTNDPTTNWQQQQQQQIASFLTTTTTTTTELTAEEHGQDTFQQLQTSTSTASNIPLISKRTREDDQ